MDGSYSALLQTLPEGRSTILVVEDEFLIRMLVSDALRDANYDVVEAANGDEGVAVLRSGVDIDLILSDVRMPGSIDGLGLLSFVRAYDPALPVVITSGHLDPGTAFDEDTDFLPKPYALEAALKLIRARLDG